MAKYIKKPVAIEAIKWDGNLKECMEFLGNSYGGHQAGNGYDVIIVKTLEGQHIASKCDYLIRDVEGEHYPCKPDMFEKTYYTEQEYAELGL